MFPLMSPLWCFFLFYCFIPDTSKMRVVDCRDAATKGIVSWEKKTNHSVALLCDGEMLLLS